MRKTLEVVMTTQLNDVTTNSTSQTFVETINFVGSAASIICYFCITVTMIGMGMRGLRAHIHCNTAVAFLLTHAMLLVGGSQPHGSDKCKVVAFFTQVSCLIAFAWLLVEVIYLFGLSMVGSVEQVKKKKTDERANEDTSQEEDHTYEEIKDPTPKQILSRQKKARRQRCVRLIIYYVISWLGPMLYAAATFPAVVDGYGEAKNCWLAADTNVIWVYGAPVPAIFIFHCVLAGFAIRNFKGRLNYAKLRQIHIPSCNSSRKTRTTLISTSTYDRALQEADEDIPSSSSSKSGSVMLPSTHEAQDVFQEQRKELVRTKAHRGVANKSSLRRHRAEDSFQNQQNGGKVIVYPPLHEVEKTTLSVGLSSREIEGPLGGYVTTLYWQATLVPLVSIVWMFGVLSVNYAAPILRYTFAVLNVIQALYLAAFYCVVDYRLRHKWHVMTVKKLNARGRAVSIVIDEEDVIEYETNRVRTKYPTKRFPNIELMNRTPTPYGPKQRLVQFQTSPTPSLTPEPTSSDSMSSKTNNQASLITGSRYSPEHHNESFISETDAQERRYPTNDDIVEKISVDEVVDVVGNSSPLPGHVAEQTPNAKQMERPVLVKSFRKKKLNAQKRLHGTLGVGTNRRYANTKNYNRFHNDGDTSDNSSKTVLPPDSNYRPSNSIPRNNEYVLQSYDSNNEVWGA